MRIDDETMKIIDKFESRWCYVNCKHENYCIKEKGHKGKHTYHNSAMGLRYKYCDCK